VTVYVPTDSEATSYEQIDVEGKVIAVRAGTSPADFATRFFKNAELKTYLADSAMAVLTDVGTKRVDGWLDSVIATGRFLAQNPQYPVRPIGDAPLDPVRLVWAVKPGDYQFQQLINTFLYSYRASGKADVSWTNWFGSVYEPPLQ
jgi:ABC-type amino acid transport substrate-binding protein